MKTFKQIKEEVGIGEAIRFGPGVYPNVDHMPVGRVGPGDYPREPKKNAEPKKNSVTLLGPEERGKKDAKEGKKKMSRVAFKKEVGKTIMSPFVAGYDMYSRAYDNAK